MAGRSLACERIPLRHRSNLQRKKQHRHSGIFRVADLGPGTMPRGKYPESPAPAGSHTLISRTPTPGGMLHANLGLPRPPPRNFQPSLPCFPSRLSPRRMSGTTVGRILSHPLPRPTHAPATTLKTNGNSAPIKPVSFPSSAWECVPRSSASHSRSRRTRPQNKRQQRHTTLTPRIAGPERCAACGRSASSACFHSMRPVKNDMQTDGERVGRAGLEPAT